MVYSGNRRLTLDEMKVNATYIRDYLLSHGWTLNAICGVLGNMQSESYINPAIWQSLKSGNLSGGFGLVQWTPATKYINWCTDNNLVYTEMDSNLLRILYEVEHNIQWIHPTVTFFDYTVSSDTPTNLAMQFMNNYERPKLRVQPWRGERAEFWYAYLDGIEPEDPNEPPSPPQSLPFFHREKIKPYLLYSKRRRII